MPSVQSQFRLQSETPINQINQKPNNNTTQQNTIQQQKKVSIEKLRWWTSFTNIYTNCFKYMHRTKGNSQNNYRKGGEKCLILQKLSTETVTIWKNWTENLEFRSINEMKSSLAGFHSRQTGSSRGSHHCAAKVT